MIAQTYRAGPHGELFVEGGIAEVTATAVDGRVYTTQGRPDGRLTLERLPAGRYTIRAVIRPCSGNCGTLDEPQGLCALDIVLPRTQRLSIRYVVTKPCVITT